MTSLITTPIYYANGLPHVGTSLTTVLADAFARSNRASGEETIFTTGVDEHGGKVAAYAAKLGMSPQELVDELTHEFKDVWASLHVEPDIFVRTSDPQHKVGVQAAFSILLSRGHIYKGIYADWYDPSSETFYKESDLINGKSPEGNEVQWFEEPCYYFKQSEFTDQVRSWIVNESPIYPSQYAEEVLAYLDQGLNDICITRTKQPWGVEVPNDPSLTIYVWFDALLSYLTSVGWPESDLNGIWPPSIQFVGKDILTRFHATFWPAILIGLGLALPARLFCHSWVLSGDKKIAKSSGYAPTPAEIVSALSEVSGIDESLAYDVLRYYLIANAPLNRDHRYTFESLIETYNNDLANDIGNLAHRVIKVLEKRFELQVDSSAIHLYSLLTTDPISTLERIRSVARRANKTITDEAPWAAVDDKEARRSLYAALGELRAIALGLSIIMPDASGRLLAMLGMEGGIIPASSWTLPAPTVLFPRIDTRKKPLKSAV